MGEVLRAASDAGATHAGMTLLRLPGPVKDVFEERLRAALPLRADRVLRRIRETRGGKMYDARFGCAAAARGAYAEAIARSSTQTAQKLGLRRAASPQVETEATTFAAPARAARLVSSSALLKRAARGGRPRGRSGRRSGRRRSARPGRRRSGCAPRASPRRCSRRRVCQPPTHGAGHPAHGGRGARRRLDVGVDEPRAAERPPGAVRRGE